MARIIDVCVSDAQSPCSNSFLGYMFFSVITHHAPDKLLAFGSEFVTYIPRTIDWSSCLKAVLAHLCKIYHRRPVEGQYSKQKVLLCLSMATEEKKAPLTPVDLEGSEDEVVVAIEDGIAVNASGWKDQLNRQYNLLSLTSIALTVDNAWAALGSSISVSIRSSYSSLLPLNILWTLTISQIQWTEGLQVLYTVWSSPSYTIRSLAWAWQR